LVTPPHPRPGVGLVLFPAVRLRLIRDTGPSRGQSAGMPISRLDDNASSVRRCPAGGGALQACSWT